MSYKDREEGDRKDPIELTPDQGNSPRGGLSTWHHQESIGKTIESLDLRLPDVAPTQGVTGTKETVIFLLHAVIR